MSSERMDKIIAKVKDATSLKDFAKDLLWSIAKELDASQGAFFTTSINKDGIHVIQFLAGYAYHLPESETIEFEFGEGLSGQVAKEGKLINIQTVPDGYIQILSGLGQSSPNSIIIFPIIKENKVVAVVELASFKLFSKEEEAFLTELAANAAALMDKF
jgi:signal transduction protein with GAF and PtsI domain